MNPREQQLTPEALAVLQAFHDEQDARQRELDKRAADASLTAHDRRMIAAAKVRRREELREELRRRNAPPPGPTRAEKAKAEKAAQRARAKARKAAHAAGKWRPSPNRATVKRVRTDWGVVPSAAAKAFAQPQPAPLQVYDEAAPLNQAVAAGKGPEDERTFVQARCGKPGLLAEVAGAAATGLAEKLDGLAAGLNAFADGEAPPPENPPLDLGRPS